VLVANKNEHWLILSTNWFQVSRRFGPRQLAVVPDFVQWKGPTIVDHCLLGFGREFDSHRPLHDSR
jgi:hypothetical protein